MVGKMLLPLLGGTPAVWNVCMVFFQMTLLAGYAYAHWIGAHLQARRQVALHLILLGVAFLLLPIAISERAASALAGSSAPAFGLLWTLAAAIGLPFFVLSASSPLLQKWFSQTAHAEAGDPYFLYAASNGGSLLALLAYPALLEPLFRLAQQSRLWTIGFALLGLCFAGCGVVVWRTRPARGAEQVPGGFITQGSPGAMVATKRAPGWRRKLGWVGLAFVPSSLMLGVTTFLSTDIAAVPLLWVIPLALYLATFILVFARREFVSRWWCARLLPIAALALTFTLMSKATEPAALLCLLHLGFFFLAAMHCHGRLADDRPDSVGLTEYYLLISVGGALGGLFNALLAPLLFTRVLEYPLGILLLCLMRSGASPDAEKPSPWWKHLVAPTGLGLLTGALALAVSSSNLSTPQVGSAIVFGLPVILSFLLSQHPIRFALGLGAIMVGGALYPDPHGRTLYAERDFFGVSRVTLDPAGSFHRLVHGNTIHGRQFIASDRQCEPLAYYHRLGPAGRIFEFYQAQSRVPEVAVVGLGAGALACYARPNERWTVYEIDPAVVRIARNPDCFTYLSRCMNAPLQMVLGDARLRLREAPEGRYGLLVLDAFSSDSIPTHLVTREALELYRSKLAPGGLLAFHISNRNVNLQPVLGDLTGTLGMVCLAWDDTASAPGDVASGREPSHWILMARSSADIAGLEGDNRWERVTPRPGRPVWTDDYSNLLGAFKW